MSKIGNPSPKRLRKSGSRWGLRSPLIGVRIVHAMPQTSVSKHVSPILAATAVLVGAILSAQSDSKSVTKLPNPYHLVPNWATLPPGVEWGSVISVDFDSKGNLWVFHRSDPGIMQFDLSGKLLTSFGTGMFVQAHGLFVDRADNIWVTDSQGKNGKGHQVFKFNPQGKVLMTLGKAGVAGAGNDVFNAPSDVLIAPNGTIFVADGHGGETNARIVKFANDGKFISTWGKKGSGPGEFDFPHSLAMDSSGRLFVADRGNSRIQIFDQDGKFLDQWRQFGRPSGIFISKDDILYSVDSESEGNVNPSYARGIYIGNAKDGSVKYFIPDPNPIATALAEGVAADAKGNVYAAGVRTKMLHKFAK
jgi:sugar lactone lactonase YvrE